MATFNEAYNGERKFVSEKHRHRALAKDLFLASLIKEDKDLRADAACLNCLDELLEWRDRCIDYVRRSSDFRTDLIMFSKCFVL